MKISHAVLAAALLCFSASGAMAINADIVVDTSTSDGFSLRTLTKNLAQAGTYTFSFLAGTNGDPSLNVISLDMTALVGSTQLLISSGGNSAYTYAATINKGLGGQLNNTFSVTVAANTVLNLVFKGLIEKTNGNKTLNITELTQTAFVAETKGGGGLPTPGPLAGAGIPALLGLMGFAALRRRSA